MTRLGRQEPTFAVGPDIADARTADEAVELAATAGIVLLEWQVGQVRRIFGQRTDQEWVATRAGLAVPRQSGKGVVLEVVTLAKCVLLGERVLWTAHEVRTMQDSFTRFRSILAGVPALSALVRSARVANGQERILFTNGAEVKFSARSKSASRGLGFRTLIFDEAQELDYLTLGAIVPTLSGQGDERTQQIYTGTPPYSAKGEVFTDLRAAAYTGGDPRLSWSEWAPEETDVMDDPAVWAKTNPSLGSVIREDKIRDELAALQARPAVFRRERLGEWGRSGDEALALDGPQWGLGRVSLPVWGDRDTRYAYGGGRTQDGPRKPVLFLGVDSSFGAEMVTVVQAVPLPEGRVALDVLAADPGLEWVQPFLVDARSVSPRVVVAYDPLRVGDLAPDVQAAGIRDGSAVNGRRVQPATSRTLTLACDGLVRAVREGTVVHDDPRLDVAAGCAIRSNYDDGRGWKLVGSRGGDVHVLIAAALALQALRGWTPRRAGSGVDDQRAVVL